MIAYIKGILREKNPTQAIVETYDIAYSLSIPVSTFQQLCEVDQAVRLFTYLHVRENGIQLFGFATVQERELFQQLLTVTGIGPRTALAILSGTTVAEFWRHIRDKNAIGLAKLPGIGKKTAERIILDLQGKQATMGDLASGTQVSGIDPKMMDEVMLGLLSLGYSKAVAQKAIEKAAQKLGANPNIEALLTASLQEI